MTGLGGSPGTIALLEALRDLTLVDLSHPLHSGMPYFPGRNAQPFERLATASLAEHGVASGRISMSEHQGTHLDAPCHFTSSDVSIERIPAADLMAEAVVIDASEAAHADPDHRLTSAEVLAWEAAHGLVPADAWVLLHTGWGRRWEDPAGYLNADASGVLHHPACSPEAAALLVERGVAGLGIDTLSVDNAAPSEVRSPTHKVLHSVGRLILENLDGLDRLPPRGVLLVIGALPVVGGTGGPARVLAFHAPTG